MSTKKNPAPKKVRATRKPAIRLADYDKLQAAPKRKPEPMVDHHAMGLVPKSTVAWYDTSLQYARDMEFYRGLVTEIGEMFGDAAKTSDDGSLQDSVLALKVPELVRSILWKPLTSTKLESPAPPAEKEDPLKVGDWVVCLAGAGGSGDGWKPEGTVQIADFDHFYSDPTIKCEGREYWFKLNNLRRATPEEVSAHLKAEEERKQAEEWAKFDELQEGDACEVLVHGDLQMLKDLFGGDKGDGGGIYPNMGPNIKYHHGNLNSGSWTSGCSPHYHWIPRTVFLHRAKGTAARLAEEAKAKELALPLEICKTRVRYADHEGVYLGPHGTQHEIGRPNGSGTWTVSVCDRDNFTVIPD